MSPSDFKRAIIRIQLDLAAKQALDALCEQRGMTQIAVMSRLVSWFSRQNEVVQASVLGSLSDAALAKLAKQLLAEIASRNNETI